MIRAVALVVLLALASPAQALVLRDMLGREMTLAAPPARIVSLVPSVTESAFAVGGEDRLVGVSDFCDWPPAARLKPRVGGMVNPSLEAIVALRPDLVVGTDEGNREETFLQLRRLGIPVYVVHAHRVAEMYDLIERVIELAGGRSITAEERVQYVRFSIEAAVARAPEVIVLADHSSGASTAGRAAPERWQALTSVPAIRAGRLYSVDLSILHRYGPRVPEGLEILARLIHPEAFR